MKHILILIVCLFAYSAEAKFSVKRNTNMKFGVVASSVDGPGTAIINTNADSKYVTGSVIDFGGTVARAKFSISGGTPSGFVSITLPASLTISKSGVSLTVDTLATDISTPAQLDSQGKLSFYVAGRLNVPTNQTAQSGLTGELTVLVQDNTSSNNDDATAPVSGSTVAPIAISETTALSFGKIEPSSVGGTLAVSTGGVTTAINVTELAGGSISQGVFTVTGDGGAAFSVTLPSSAALTSGSYSMTVNNFQHDAGVSPAIGGGGSKAINIGATLNVGADQGGGNYSGSYTISVNYN